MATGSRPRPPRSAVRAAVAAALADLEPGDRVLVALSGGPDSLALTAAAVRVSARRGLVCDALVVEHGLQPGSRAIAERAVGQALLLGCAHAQVARVEVGREGGPEAAARNARYEALHLAAVQSGAAGILLGHTLDDQAETVLLGLARGSGTRSIAGMAPRRGLLRRPLLGLPREVVRAAAQAAASEDPRLAPWDDRHNEDRSYSRVRVRLDALPALVEALGPSVVAALGRTAALAREDADALDDWADREWRTLADPEQPMRLPDPATSNLPEAVLSRIVRIFLIQCGCPPGSLTGEHVGAAVALWVNDSQAEIALPGRRWVRREGGDLVVRA